MSFNKIMRMMQDLKNQRSELLLSAQAALDKDDMGTYTAQYEAATALNPKIEACQNSLNELGRFKDDGTPSPAGLVQDKDGSQVATDMRASAEYAQAFALAIATNLNPKTARGVEGARILLDALTESGSSGADGGFLVPVDMQTKINEVRRTLVALASVFNAEDVTAPTGFRVYDAKPTAGFTKVKEMDTIPKDAQPSFKRIEYALEDYALIVPMSNDLATDNTAGLIAYLSRWFAYKGVLTENTQLLALLDTLTGTALTSGKEFKGIQTALNVDIDPSISATASLITNQSGFNVLDTLTDGMGRPLLMPDPIQPTKLIVRGRPITVMPDSLLPNDATSGAPLYIGDFAQYGSLLRASTMAVASTTVGGKSWETNSTEVRAVMRMDTMTTDDKAAVKRFIPLG